MSETYNNIWTFGHSTRSPEEFVAALRPIQIEEPVDVRRYPGSKKYPQFNASAMETSLPESGIRYMPLMELGCRRKPRPDSPNTVWRNEAFRGYADCAETKDFADGIVKLTEVATRKRTAYMCSEVVWRRCHRAIISD